MILKEEHSSNYAPFNPIHMEAYTKPYEERDTLFKVGLGMIAFCLFVYLNAGSIENNPDPLGLSILINYCATAFYFVMLCLSNITRTSNAFKGTNRYHYICLLSLATISCYTLNLEINVFDNFSLWVDSYVLIMYGGLLSVCFMDKLPSYCRIPIFLILGFGTAMAAYFTIYLLPFTPFAILLGVFLGLTLHLVVPLLVLINHITIFVRTEKSKNESIAYGVGLLAPIILAILFVSQWKATGQIIEKAYSRNHLATQRGLPAWVAISKELSDGFFTQRILKGEIVYTSFQSSGWGNWGGIGSNSFQDKKEHDPLVAIATVIHGELPISRSDRLQIIKFYSENRHDTHRKLWSGKNLTTSNIQTKIQAFPEYRLAYTEKTFTINNNNYWNRAEEALYTFQLPEGTVATSLSLWINGGEEQSRLSTRGKADSAYVAIVGVEKRDPALLHWQEGNRLTVTVFPCPTDEERIFKIGVTSPLQVQGNQLVLPNIEFEGPPADYAKQTTSVEFPSQPNTNYELDVYNQLSCPIIPISEAHFSFNNKTFWMDSYQPDFKHFDPEFVYLDINKSWELNEFKAICELYKGKKILVYKWQETEPIDENSSILFEALQNQNFSLFPTDVIHEPSKSILITKSTKKSPNLSDLKETDFGKSLIKRLQNRDEKVQLFSLSENLSPYLQSLKEFHAFEYASGSLTDLKKLAHKKQFPTAHPSSNAIVLHASKTVLYSQENTAGFESKAPDHLMRLFAYNQILKKIGKGYFQSGYENQELVDIASEAHIVSPISSLIVLETKKDYERFGIEENEDGLGNASDKKKALKNATNNNSGAVPEPHEWLFIILSILGLLLLQFKKLKG